MKIPVLAKPATYQPAVQPKNVHVQMNPMSLSTVTIHAGSVLAGKRDRFLALHHLFTTDSNAIPNGWQMKNGVLTRASVHFLPLEMPNDLVRSSHGESMDVYRTRW